MFPMAVVIIGLKVYDKFHIGASDVIFSSFSIESIAYVLYQTIIDAVLSLKSKYGDGTVEWIIIHLLHIGTVYITTSNSIFAYESEDDYKTLLQVISHLDKLFQNM